MKDGMFVFDAAVHCQDFSDAQIKPGSDGRRVRILREQLTGFINLTGRRGPPPETETFSNPDLDWGNRMLFENADTDMAVRVLGSAVLPLARGARAGRAQPRPGASRTRSASS